MRKEFFCYTVQFNNLLKATNQTVTLPIDKDSDFEWIKSTRSMGNTGNLSLTDGVMGQQFPNMRVWIYDTGRGAWLTDKPVSVNNAFGSAQYPAILAEPLLIRGGSGLNVQVFNDYTNLDIVFTQLTLVGRKVKGGEI